VATCHYTTVLPTHIAAMSSLPPSLPPLRRRLQGSAPRRGIHDLQLLPSSH
jgi:hypothetical protein